MSINPLDDEAKIQSSVAIEILRFLQKECRKNDGTLSREDFERFSILHYGISLPEHIPAAFADKLVHETVEILLNVLISVMDEYKLEVLTDHMFDVIVSKFDKTYIYNLIKDSQKQQGGEQR